MRKVCVGCGENKPLSDFHKAGIRPSGIQEFQPLCKKCRVNEGFENHLKEYGLTVEDFNQLVSKQGGVCAICKKPQHRGKSRRLTVDHDHKTGKVRALLCTRCNAGLGMFNDSIELVRAANEYLQKFQQ